MNRRGFLGTLLATAVLDPEKLLWIPGERKIFVPAPVSPLVFINLDMVRATGFWHNGGNVALVRVDQLDRLCRWAYEVESQRLLNVAAAFHLEKPWTLHVEDLKLV